MPQKILRNEKNSTYPVHIYEAYNQGKRLRLTYFGFGSISFWRRSWGIHPEREFQNNMKYCDFRVQIHLSHKIFRQCKLKSENVNLILETRYDFQTVPNVFQKNVLDVKWPAFAVLVFLTSAKSSQHVELLLKTVVRRSVSQILEGGSPTKEWKWAAWRTQKSFLKAIGMRNLSFTLLWLLYM